LTDLNYLVTINLVTMANKKKYPSEINTTTIRVDMGTYHLLMHLSMKKGISVAQVLKEMLAEQGHVLETARAPASQGALNSQGGEQ
jgi:hypothetical protein